MSFGFESDHPLMTGIYNRWGKLLGEGCRSSSVPPQFLAALVANESGGDPGLTRFNPYVYQCLLAVRNGARAHYATFTQQDLRSVSEGEIIECSASWGLTQIMGYEVLAAGETPRRLLEPEYNLRRTLRSLAVYSEYYGVDLREDFEDLFRCWNTGRPDGATKDPEYVGKGLRRMALYRQLSLPSGPVTVRAA